MLEEKSFIAYKEMHSKTLLTQYSHKQGQLNVNSSEWNKNWLELQVNNCRVNTTPLSQKLFIVSSKMRGYDITLIPKLLFRNMYNLHFWREMSNWI